MYQTLLLVVVEVPKPSLSAGVYTAFSPGAPGAPEDEEAAFANPTIPSTNRLATRTAAHTTDILSTPALAISFPFVIKRRTAPCPSARNSSIIHVSVQSAQHTLQAHEQRLQQPHYGGQRYDPPRTRLRMRAPERPGHFGRSDEAPYPGAARMMASSYEPSRRHSVGWPSRSTPDLVNRRCPPPLTLKRQRRSHVSRRGHPLWARTGRRSGGRGLPSGPHHIADNEQFHEDHNAHEQDGNAANQDPVVLRLPAPPRSGFRHT